MAVWGLDAFGVRSWLLTFGRDNVIPSRPSRKSQDLTPATLANSERNTNIRRCSSSTALGIRSSSIFRHFEVDMAVAVLNQAYSLSVTSPGSGTGYFPLVFPRSGAGEIIDSLSTSGANS